MNGDSTIRSPAADFLLKNSATTNTYHVLECDRCLANDVGASTKHSDGTRDLHEEHPASQGEANSACSVGFDSATPHSVTVPFVNDTDGYRRNGVAGQNDGTYVRWTQPSHPVLFRDWYVYYYCNEDVVKKMVRLQQTGGFLKAYLTRYFQAWSWSGEAEFYILMLPTLVWVGHPEMAVHIASMLCLNLYLTGIIKDAICCPRPPCPPLELRGNKLTHETEYGFPSTHSCHAVVFAYFIYKEITLIAPDYALVNLLLGVFFAANISLSRVYLGMHWPGDLVGGWLVAIACTIVHSAFLSSWESLLVTYRYPAWWAYVLVYAIIHILAVVHATPHDPCPCYIDSMRFTGALGGSIIGLWLYARRYDTIVTRKPEVSFAEACLTWQFALEWILCIGVVVACRELTSWLCTKTLRPIFMFCSGAYQSRLPRMLQRPYLVLAWLIGLTTSGNEMGKRRFEPITSTNAFGFMHSQRRGSCVSNSGDNTVHNRTNKCIAYSNTTNIAVNAVSTNSKAVSENETGSEMVCVHTHHATGCDPHRREDTEKSRGDMNDTTRYRAGAASEAVSANHVLNHDVKSTRLQRSDAVGGLLHHSAREVNHISSPLKSAAHAKSDKPDVVKATSLRNSSAPNMYLGDYLNSSAEHYVVEEPDGYLAASQVWSLRTHGHWWLWDVHRRTCAYFVTGFACTFICPVLLREVFHFAQ